MGFNKFPYIRAAILGSIVGDALGVPVEFKSRDELKLYPVTDMIGFGTHNQPAGTWSDDSSLLLATADSLSGGFSLDDMMEKYSRWLYEGDYTPYGKVFDCGNTTRDAIGSFHRGVPAAFCGGFEEHENGNGSLMRFLPMSIMMCEIYNNTMYNGRWGLISKINAVSALTHAHPISMAGCGLYTGIIGALLETKGGRESLESSLKSAFSMANSDYNYHNSGNLFHDPSYEHAIEKYSRLSDINIFAGLPEDEIESGGYVVSTVEAALWCFLNTQSYKECVLKAVNLGNDTDTTAAVAGGLAGLWYGIESIPEDWINILPRLDWIETIISRFEARVEYEYSQRHR